MGRGGDGDGPPHPLGACGTSTPYHSKILATPLLITATRTRTKTTFVALWDPIRVSEIKQEAQLLLGDRATRKHAKDS